MTSHADPAADPPAAGSADARGWKGGLQQCMSWLHTWTGLVLSVVLYFMFVTGTAGYFNSEIDRWMQAQPPAARAPHMDARTMLDTGVARLRQVMPDARNWSVSLPNGRRNPDLALYAEPKPGADGKAGKEFSEQLDPATSAPRAGALKTGGGDALYVMHYSLHYIPYEVAIYIVGIATMFMLVAIVSGVIVHKKIFADFFTFRPGKGQRSWLDAHNVISVMSLPFFVMITYSGLVFYTYDYFPSVRTALYGAGKEAQQTFEREVYGEESFYDTPAAGRAAQMTPLLPLVEQAAAAWGGMERVSYIEIINLNDASARIRVSARRERSVNPDYVSWWFDGVSGAPLSTPGAKGKTGADNFSDTITALHEGHFASPVLRWLYLASGLLGAGMIATGLLVWTSKRRQQLGKRGEPDAGLKFVEHFNVGIIAGLPIAVAVYFWANRLLPADLATRADWELHALFIAWALALAHAALRPTPCAWREQLALAAALYGLLPLLNALTTQSHLAASLPAGDWVLAGFDLTMLVLGTGFGWAWIKLRGRTVGRPAASETLTATRSPASLS